MEIQNHSNHVQLEHNQSSLAELPKRLEENCTACNPLSPTTCLSGCKTWKVKNQFRRLYEKTKRPEFMAELLNTLKNKRRVKLLEVIAREYCSEPQLQQRLKVLGFNQSQKTIVDEYINPLVEVGLAEETRNTYHATIFGSRVNELMRDFRDLEEVLPPHSECYEEIALDAIRNEPATYEDLRKIIPAKSVARVLNRLQASVLVEKSLERDYIFFFRTKRDSGISSLSPTETRIYENIPVDGISAKKLSEKSQISLRRTYKYLRKLKGKKLVFTRKKPVSYKLTARGARTVQMLEAIHDLALEVLRTAAQIVRDESLEELLPLDTSSRTSKKRKDQEFVPLTTMSLIRNRTVGC